MITTVFWGFALVLLGISLVVKALFGISIPFIRALIGALFIYAGIVLVTGLGSYDHKKTKLSIFTQEQTIFNPAIQSYNIILAQSSLDLSKLDFTNPIEITVSVLLGSGTIIIPDHIPLTIIAESALGGLQLPDETIINWGSKKIIPGVGQKPRLILHAKAVLGNLLIHYA